MAKSNAVVSPNLGLYYDRPAIALDPRALQEGNNFRIRGGKLNNFNLGRERFPTNNPTLTLGQYVMAINNFFLRSGAEHLIFVTKQDIYKLVTGSPDTVAYINSRYETGTASASGTSVTGVGTLWNTTIAGTSWKNAKAGDQISFGATGRTDPNATWFTIQSVTNDTTLTLTASAGVIGAGAYTIRQRFTGDTDDFWSTDVFTRNENTGADEWWATNGVDPIVRWNGTATQLELMGSLGFTASSLRVYSNMMIYGNIVQAGTLKPTDIINSDIGDPADVTTGLSEQFRVHDGHDGIIRMERIADALAIYSNDHVVLAQFVGDPLVFVFRVAVNGFGPLGPRAVARFPDYHEFIADDSEYRFDGANAVRINEHVWREILRTHDPSKSVFTNNHFDEENGELLWSIPRTEDTGVSNKQLGPSTAYSEHYLEPVRQGQPTPYAKRDHKFTATGFFERQSGLTWNQLTSTWASYNFRWNDQFFAADFPQNIGGDDQGRLWIFGHTQNDGATGLPSFVRFGRRTFDSRMRGLVRRIYPFVATLANLLNVTLRLMDHAAGEATIIDEKTFDQTLPQGGHFVSFFRRGRFWEVEFGTDGPNEPYELHGYDYDGTEGGLR